MNNPFFSIIIPTYNRRSLVMRAIDSVLSQSFKNFELIIVDDGSTDDTIQYVSNLKETRLTVIKHDKNSGVSIARNTGVKNSKGSWIFTLDSDDELLSDSLLFAHKQAIKCPKNIGMIRFLNKQEDGSLTPIPPFSEEVWNFIDYLKWNEKMLNSKNTDSCKIIKRECFHEVKYPSSRALESEFHINFSEKFNIKCIPKPLILVHNDATNRLSIPSKDLLRKIAKDTVISNRRILKKNGKLIRKVTPKLYNRKISSTAFYCYLANLKLTGFKYSLIAIFNAPLNIRNWVMLLGLVWPTLLLNIKLKRQKSFNIKT